MEFRFRKKNEICLNGRQFLLLLSVAVMMVFVTVRQVLSNTATKQEQKYQLHIRNKVARVRILCLILTTTANRNKTIAVNDTWAKRCDKHFFVYGKPGKSQNYESNLYVRVREGRKHLTGKVRHALQYAYENYKDSYDWILKCDDDTYVIVNNLRYLLSETDPKKPGYIGFHMKTKLTLETGYMSGGSGYVISSQALRLLVQRGFQNGSCKEDGGDEDVEIGLCLAKSGVPIITSLDTQGRETFHPGALERHLYPPHPDWLHNYAWNQVPKFGAGCCSRYSISFHRVTPEQHYVFEHLLYNTSVFGLKGGNKPKAPAFEPDTLKPNL